MKTFQRKATYYAKGGNLVAYLCKIAYIMKRANKFKSKFSVYVFRTVTTFTMYASSEASEQCEYPAVIDLYFFIYKILSFHTVNLID